MDCAKTGQLLYHLRQEKAMTQKQVAELMNISDKTISKWERGLGCPDVCLLPELSRIFGINIEEILLGHIVQNERVGGNMRKIQFYSCPQCKNLITATGDCSISCCGKKLESLIADKADEYHQVTLEPVEDEWYFSASHEMTKEHHISFAAYVTGDKIFLVKQYPEWSFQFRFHKFGHGKLYVYCSQHELFYQPI